jgi:hypothetical protein
LHQISLITELLFAKYKLSVSNFNPDGHIKIRLRQIGSQKLPLCQTIDGC